MITLLGALLGLFGSAMPECLKFFRDRADRIHELAILDRQIAMQKEGFTQRLEEIRTQADISESQAIYKTYNVGIHWVDALNGSVRPVLAYAFFALYAVTKLLQFSMLDPTIPNSILILWQEEDQAIFAGIISFYFGQRAMAKLRK